VLTFGDVMRYLYSHGSREPKHPNKSFIKNLVVSKLLLTFVKHISHRCMFERIYVCGFFFLKKKVLKFLTNQNKSFTFVEEIKFLRLLKK
jgi:hypothetical protein